MQATENLCAKAESAGYKVIKGSFVAPCFDHHSKSLFIPMRQVTSDEIAFFISGMSISINREALLFFLMCPLLGW